MVQEVKCKPVVWVFVYAFVDSVLTRGFEMCITCVSFMSDNVCVCVFSSQNEELS